MPKANDSIAAIKKIYDDGGFDISERKYTFAKMPFKKGRKLYAYLTVIAAEIEKGQMGFLDSDKFELSIEPLLMQYTMCDGFKLDTIEDHFDEFTSDYNQFVMMSIQGHAAPFLPAASTGSTSTAPANRENTLKKQM